MIETERLLLREYTPDDFDALYEIVSDPETMAHYPAPFDEERTRRWIDWNLENYAKYGFGLWAAVLKETGEFIGDCGLTLQNIDGEMLPEIGYHIHKKYWRRGFAKEAAQAVRDWTFLNTKYNVLYSYMKYTNEGSWRTAMANGMKKVKEYPDPKNTISYAFAITREEWRRAVLSFRKLTDFGRDIMYSILKDAYSFDERCAQCWDGNWRETDDFFFDHPEIADKYGFATCFNGEPIGFICWDPRNRPEYVEIGHNAIRTAWKGNGFGKAQLTEALRRIREYAGLKEIRVRTNSNLIAPRNYESVGFVLYDRKENPGETAFSGDDLYYRIQLQREQMGNA